MFDTACFLGGCVEREQAQRLVVLSGKKGVKVTADALQPLVDQGNVCAIGGHRAGFHGL